MHETILLTQSEIKELITMKEVIETVENAFKVFAEGKVEMPAKKYLFFKKYNGDLRIMPCFVHDADEAGVKCVNVHPDNPKKYDLPTIMAIIELVDPKTGFPLAIMDGTWITNMRTGAAAGVATKYLARDNSKTLGIVGAGVQAYKQLEALNEVMEIKKVKVTSRTPNSRERFAKTASEKYDLNVQAVDTIKEAVEGSDVLVTTTPVRKPIVKSEWVSEGMHINAIGADAPGKQELEGKILKKAKIIIDCWEQASHSGEINIPVSEGLLTRDDIHANIGDVIINKKPGRVSDDEITIFDSTGLAVQDITTAWRIYEKALETDLGGKIRFLD